MNILGANIDIPNISGMDIVKAPFGGDDNLFNMAASMIPGVGTYLGQERANSANVALAREQMAFQDSQAKRQMDFQERMSSSAYQRGVEDLKKAGLNPLLAVPGGASTPSGASASGSLADVKNSAAGVSPEILSALSSIMGMKQTQAQIDNINMDTNLKETSSAVNIGQAALNTQNYGNNQTMMERVKAETLQSISNARQARANEENLRRGAPPSWLGRPDIKTQQRFDNWINKILDFFGDPKNKPIDTKGTNYKFEK